MRKITLILSLLAFLAYADDCVGVFSSIEDEDGTYSFVGDRLTPDKVGCIPLDAKKVKSFHDNGKVKSEYKIQKGDVTGEFSEFFSSGTLKCSGVYKNGFLEGKFRCYYESGQVRREAFYRNGLEEGVVKEYYKENGKICGQGKYRKGKLVGDYKCADGRFGLDGINCDCYGLKIH